ncbi:helix-turn-helix domain-containing protein [Sungkyunkwania multivorans]|uniref:Helix-turn-helix domain-containing protein n=1 Tax=Sungkyunkwania multivorans TaxID=1173618 RepID=A0ABW3CXV8_9FLAO
MSQQAFADLFDLKRGTLGAYEEGRSEPKIETIIKIANYFSISIDSMLTDELTVNELLRFKGDLATDIDEYMRERFVAVPCITERTATDYITNYDKSTYVNELPTLQLPVPEDAELRGYTITNLEMTSHDKGLYPDDVVIGEKVALSDVKGLKNGTLVLCLINNELILRRIYFVKSKIVLRADHKNINDKLFDVADLKELWEIKYVFNQRIPDYTDIVEERMLLLEQEFEKLRERFGGGS